MFTLHTLHSRPVYTALLLEYKDITDKAEIRLTDKKLSVAHRLDKHYPRDQGEIDLHAFFKRLNESEKGSSSEII